MNRRRLLGMLLISPLLLAAGSVRHKVVYHINSGDPDSQRSVLRNLNNHLAAMGEANLEIKVVLQGAGVSLLLLPEALAHTRRLRHANASENFRAHIDTLRARGVVFQVSAPALLEYGIDAQHDLYRVAPRDVVTNALAHLTELQARGYTYIKP